MNAHSHHAKSFLFLLKSPGANSCLASSYNHPSSGLFNSAKFVVDMLKSHHVKADIVEVNDGNDIDREAIKSGADIVILEAIWATPAKLRELSGLKRHANRSFVVRNHSNFPFLSMEGVAIDWLLEYATIPRVHVACNSPLAAFELGELLRAKWAFNPHMLYLPNYYPVSHHAHHREHGHSSDSTRHILDVGCFGAIRPLKNHLEQAMASIIFARDLGLHLRFHINATRVEGRGDSILKNLRAMFTHTPNALLVEHGWMDHHDFIRLCRSMDIGLQVSFSETFNIVAADLVNEGVPVVGSHELPWLPRDLCAHPTSSIDIAEHMHVAAIQGAHEACENLRQYSEVSVGHWLHFAARGTR